MKYFILSAITAAGILFSPICTAQEYRIAAVVNDDIISVADLENRIDLAVLVSHMPATDEMRASVRKQALASLIDDAVRMQEAKRQGVSVSQNEINAALEQIAQQNNAPVDDFLKAFNTHLAAFDSLKKQITSQIAWSNVIKRTLRPKINITENDIDSALAENSRDAGKTEYLVSAIFLRNGGDTSGNTELADKLYNEIQSGARFSDVARQFSNGVEAANGGVIGWVRPGQLESELDGIIAQMPEGSIAKPITTTAGIYIIGLQKKRTIAPLSADAQEKFHIKQLFIPMKSDTDETRRMEVLNVIRDLQQKVTSCATMDEAMSAHPDNKTEDLGFLTRDELEPKKAAMLDELGVDRLSRPFPGDDGVTIMMVCGKQTGSADQSVREIIANKLGGERLDKMQLRYLQDLKASAYVDVKI